MAGGIDWFRWHHGTVIDPKWRVVARKSGTTVRDVLAVFACFLERASQAEPRGSIDGWAADDIGAGLDMDADQVCAIYDAMQGKVLDGDMLSGWEKRQPKREREDGTAADRKRNQRAREAASEASDTPDTTNSERVTPSHTKSHQVTHREEKRREEVNHHQELPLIVEPEAKAPAKPSPPKRATSLPADFYPDDTGISYADQRRVSLAVELESFRNYHAAKGSTMKSWQAAWRTWCDKAVEFGRAGVVANGARASPRKTLTETRAETIAALTGQTQGSRNERDIPGTCERIA